MRAKTNIDPVWADGKPSVRPGSKSAPGALRRWAAGLVAVGLSVAGFGLLEPMVSSAEPVPAATSSVVDDGTRVVDFTRDWKFFLATRTPRVTDASTVTVADEGISTSEAISPTFDDSAWRTVRVPHDFSIEGAKVSEGSNSQAYLQGGLGWYRKTFSVPESMRVSGKRVIIDFESVYQNSIVYLNGELVGNYPSGYTGFAYDLTDLLNYGDGEVNTLAVKVQNPAPSGRWYTGSGIVGPVNLIVTEAVRFTRNGIDFKAPALEQTFKADGSAELALKAGVFSNATNGVIWVKTTVRDAKGKVVATKDSEQVETNPTNLVNLTDSVKIPAVQLWYPWNLGTPYRYRITTDLFYLANGSTQTRLMDSVETPYGFRWFAMDNGESGNPGRGGLSVNGKYTKLQGVDLHHDSGALGAAQNRDAFERQMKILMSMGVNGYRSAHNPPSKAIIDLSSELGILVVEEAYDGWGASKADYDFGRFFFQSVPSDWAGLGAHGLLSPPRPGVDYEGAQYTWSDWVIQEMVKRDRNEASVIMWSIGNEIRGVGSRPAWYQPARYDIKNLGGATGLNQYTEAVRLGEAIKAVDTSRLVVMGGDQQRQAPAMASEWGRINQYLDGYGLNYNTANSVDQLTERFRNTTFFFESESSSQTSSRGVYLDPQFRNSGINQTPGRRGGSNYDNDFASWTMSNEYGLKKDRDRKAFAGQFIWSGFDYLGEPTPYNVYPVGTSSFGAIDTAGFPKDSYYLFRSQWMDASRGAQVHVLPGNWNSWRAGEQVEVWVNANVPTVELLLNGRSLGRKSFDEKRTAYGKSYYETSEPTSDDKTWPTPGGNTGGYSSTGATVIKASGDSEIAAGTNYGKLHLTWQVPFEKGVLEARAYESASATTPVAVDAVKTAGDPYTIKLGASKDVIKADGTSLSYVEATVVDEAGNAVPNANNLLDFDVSGGAIVGVDNGQLESTELYKWGNLERNTKSQRSAYAGKALVILQSNEGQAGTMQLTVRSDGLAPAVLPIAVTGDGQGSAPAAVKLAPTGETILPVSYTVPAGGSLTLPRQVRVAYHDPKVGRYEVNRTVTWAAVDEAALSAPGLVTVSGSVAGVAGSAKALLNVVAAGPVTDLALNQSLGSSSQIFDWAQVPRDSALRAGALATATFTGTQSDYPNNMINGNATTVWTNQFSRSATVLLPGENRSRARESVEFYWDAPRTLQAASLTFLTDSSRALPAEFKVQYWDGLSWQAAENVTHKITGNQVDFTFDRVLSAKIRIEMVNATPFTATGHIGISQAQLKGSQVSLTPSKADLQAALTKAQTYPEADYTGASFAQIKTAIKNGNEVMANAAASSEQIAEAVAALHKAMEGLAIKTPVEPTPKPTPTPTPIPTPTPTGTGTLTSSPSPTSNPTATSKTTVTRTQQVTTTQTVTPRGDLYSTPGFHFVNGRTWWTTCEPYSQTVRCRTEIWASRVVLEKGAFVQRNGWVFNNLTYLPLLSKAGWGANPLANTTAWIAADGRRWRTECGTPETGALGCRTWVWSEYYQSQRTSLGWTYRPSQGWVLNNMVRFKAS